MKTQSWRVTGKRPSDDTKKNRNRELARGWLQTLAAFVLVVAMSAVAKADNSPFQLVTQDMISAQLDEINGFGQFFGPDASSPITFSSNENLQTLSFSFVTMPGSTYEGLSLTLNGSGAFDSGNNLWEWSFSGSLGSNTLAGSGSESALSSGRSPGEETQTKSQMTETRKDGTEITRYYADKKTYDDNGKETGTTIWQTDKDGKRTGPDTTLKGQANNDGNYRWQVDGPPFDITTSGFTPPVGGPGYFVTTISATPEPSSLLLLGSGVIGLSGSLRKRLRTRTGG